MKSCSSTLSANAKLRRSENEKKKMAWNSPVLGSACVRTPPKSCWLDRPHIYRAVAARSGPPPPPVPIPDSNAPKPKIDPPKPKLSAAKKDTKKSLKGVVVKKKPKVSEKTQGKGNEGTKSASPTSAKDSPHKESDEKPPAKRQKLG